MKPEKPTGYKAYLVRLWHEGDGVWRGTIENPHTSERLAFAEVEALLAYIRDQVANTAPEDI